MKLAEVLHRASSEPGDRRTALGRHAGLITGLSPALLEVEVGDYEKLVDGYREVLASPGNPTPPLTAVVLTRNEEESIRGCLEALADDVDRVLLIDAESQDATVDVARASFRHLTHIRRPWCDDFAAQRNTAFDHLRGSGWLVHVDADETLAPESAGHLRSVLAVLDHLLPGTDLVVSPRIVDTGSAVHANTMRVMRVGTALRFRGRLHERPYDPEGNMPPHVGVRVEFRHTGYEPDVIKRKGKALNYARIVRSCLAEEPGNPKWQFYAVRDAMVTETLGPAGARAAFHRLHGALAQYERPGLCDYETERYADTLVLLCDLALRFGGGKEIADLAPALKAGGRTLEASFYSTFTEFSGLLARASRLQDELARATRSGNGADHEMLGRCCDLQALIAMSCGRYDEVAPLLAEARGRGAGKLTERTLSELGAHLLDRAEEVAAPPRRLAPRQDLEGADGAVPMEAAAGE